MKIIRKKINCWPLSTTFIGIYWWTKDYLYSIQRELYESTMLDRNKWPDEHEYIRFINDIKESVVQKTTRLQYAYWRRLNEAYKQIEDLCNIVNVFYCEKSTRLLHIPVLCYRLVRMIIAIFILFIVAYRCEKAVKHEMLVVQAILDLDDPEMPAFLFLRNGNEEAFYGELADSYQFLNGRSL
ncbi:hypothetical protein HNY73_012763 [Argiope bruennichi]|uniref:Uncharacterized protein n=1 Tax=Argiope bruennichi TaxID=94029 RepID=A0A8T0F1T1_ARGBR|nr:hypothetical protein HNY73_012763 [Argiope bruennichi]